MKYLIFLLLTSSFNISFAQSHLDTILLSDKFSWITIGAGTSTLKGTSGVIDYTIQKKNKLFSTRLHVGSGGDSFASAAFHYGIATHKANGHYSASIGLAIIAMGNGTGGRYTGAGLDIGAQGFLKLGRVGVGIYLLANLNSYQNHVSFMVAMQFGRLR